MIPLIRSLTELMSITRPKVQENKYNQNNKFNMLTEDSGQRKRYIVSKMEKEVKLPAIHRTKRHEWIMSKEALKKLLGELDYNNQIQSSYDLTLLERQNSQGRDAA